MKLLRSSRLVAALIALISILFTQAAVASYICPGLSTEHVAQAAQSMDMAEETHVWHMSPG